MAHRRSGRLQLTATEWDTQECDRARHGGRAELPRVRTDPRPFRTSDAAFDVASALVEACRLERGLPPLSIIGDFVVPPLDGADTRDFQTLHFDFGLPLDPKVDQDVARYTALYVPADIAGVQAATRLVPLVALLGQRSWPPPAELVERLTSYGRTHGAWDDDLGYTEGSLARIIEAAATSSGSPILPSVKVEPDFLCGLEFDSLPSERTFFSRYGLRVSRRRDRVRLEPGELLAIRQPSGRARPTRERANRESCVSASSATSLQPAAQRKLRDDVLRAFSPAKVRLVPDGTGR